MKKIRIAAALVALSLLTACAPTVMQKPGATSMDFERDHASCQYEAEKYSAPASADFGVMLHAATRKTQLTRMCLQQRGWVASR